MIFSVAADELLKIFTFREIPVEDGIPASQRTWLPSELNKVPPPETVPH